MKSNLFSVNLKFCHQQQENTKLLALVNSNGTQDLQSIKQEVRCDQVHYHKSVTEGRGSAVKNLPIMQDMQV